jgi:hypothetical protein
MVVSALGKGTDGELEAYDESVFEEPEALI